MLNTDAITDTPLEIIVNKISKHTRARVNKMIAGGRRRVIGSGACGTVYELDAHRVFKVGRGVGNGYDRWISFCVSRRSKHLPRVDFLARDGSNVYVVMEKLQNAWEVFDFDSCYGTESALKRYLNDGKDMQTAFGDLDAREQNFFKTHISVRAGKRLQSLVNESGLYLNDLHTGNFMVRKGYGKKPTIVITDPIV